MARIPLFHILAILTLAIIASCSADLAVETKAVDVSCEDLAADSPSMNQCLAQESARNNLKLSITTESFTSNNKDVSIGFCRR